MIAMEGRAPSPCDVSVRDLADRPPRALDDGAVPDLGGSRVRLLATPHVPQNWESIALFERLTMTTTPSERTTTWFPSALSCSISDAKV